MGGNLGRFFDPLHFPLHPCGMRSTKSFSRSSEAPSRGPGRSVSAPPPIRRYPRFFLDFDWFVESHGCSTLGRGLEISVRGAMLPVACLSPFTPEVTLFVSLPARQNMFKARCSARQRDGQGWVLSFHDVSPEDLQLLGSTLIAEFGALALPEASITEAVAEPMTLELAIEENP